MRGYRVAYLNPRPCNQRHRWSIAPAPGTSKLRSSPATCTARIPTRAGGSPGETQRVPARCRGVHTRCRGFHNCGVEFHTSSVMPSHVRTAAVRLGALLLIVGARTGRHGRRNQDPRRGVERRRVHRQRRRDGDRHADRSPVGEKGRRRRPSAARTTRTRGRPPPTPSSPIPTGRRSRCFSLP